jgi:hypothetical protein
MKAFAKGMLGVLMAACFVASAAFSLDNPRGTSILHLRGKTVSVEYGRPSLRGRTVDALLGKLPPGGIWRLGDDTSTTFKTEIDLAFGDVTIPAGEYSIWMQRQADNSWKLLLFISGPHDGIPPEMVTITLNPTMVRDRGGWVTIQWGKLEAKAFFAPK